MLFIGDSLTRYQYFGLVYFLEYKKWPLRYPATGFDPCFQADEHNNTVCSKPNEPNVCCEYDWESYDHGGWPGFMQSLGGGMNGGLFHGRMEAKSIRAKDSIEAEGYQYVSSKSDGRVKLSFVGEFGWGRKLGGSEVFRGWNFTSCAYHATCRYSPEQYQSNLDRYANNDFDWYYPDIATAFGSSSIPFAQHQNTSYIFYNRGLWGAIEMPKASMMMDALADMIGGNKTSSNRCFYKSTTGCDKSREENIGALEYSYVRKAAYYAGCEYFDVAHLTDEFSTFHYKHPYPPRTMTEYRHIFWDSVHYVSLQMAFAFL
jgi:hypothetical protein